VVLVLAPWNYPFHLLTLPLAYALAAGNTAVVKPSELAPATSSVLARLLPQYLDDQAVAVAEGGPAVATSLLEQRWDHIFYTGGGRVGRIVMEAASRHLTPVTLELGGKSPALVDASADLEVAARRIVWGKFVNAGQTCVAPDHVLVDRRVGDELVGLLGQAVRQFYGDDPRSSPDYGRIVNDAHFERLQGLLAASPHAEVVTGGDAEPATRYLAPTVVTGVRPDDPLSTEEIFGPILPVVAYDGLDDAIARVNTGDRPLALYVFAEDRRVSDRVVAETSSGGVCVNATLVHLGVFDLPFGGVGASGMGAYHGRAGFDTFSHRKGVLERSTRFDPSLAYPPYTLVKRWLLRRALPGR
jgi:aldehyde dehydrogenase (NAD+)